MDVLEAIRSGRSASSFKPAPVSEQKILSVFNAARMAPSAENRQPWKFVLVSDQDLKAKVQAAVGNAGAKALADAPLAVVACARLDEAEAMVGGYMNSYPVDLGIALAHLTLAATSEGLATNWVFAFSEDKVRAALRIPDDVRIVGVTPLGFPETITPPEGRKHLHEILSYNGYE